MTNFLLVQDLINRMVEYAALYENKERGASFGLSYIARAYKAGATFSIEYTVRFPIDIPEWVLPKIRFTYSDAAPYDFFAIPQIEIRFYYEDDLINTLTAVLAYYKSLQVLKTSYITKEFELMSTHVIVFDRCSYFVEDNEYKLNDGETIVYRGTHDECSTKCERMNRNLEQQFKGAK